MIVLSAITVFLDAQVLATCRTSGGVTWHTFGFCDLLHISGTAEAIDSRVCRAFDAAFAKSLWPLFVFLSAHDACVVAGGI